MKDEIVKINYEKYYGQAMWKTWQFVLGLVIEFVGTFIINIIGLSACLLHSNDLYDVNALFVGLSFGLTYLFITQIFERLSTCHFNPAITLVSLFMGESSVLYCFTAMVIQMLAVTFATVILDAVLGDYLNILYTTVFQAKDMNLAAVMISEFIGTLLITCSRIVPAQDSFSKHLQTSLAIICSVSVLIPYSGGAVNPARATGPSVVLMSMPAYYWVYWAGPFAASFVTMFLLYTGIIHNAQKPLNF